MIAATSHKAAIFVDRTCTEHWIVRDPDGNYWIVPSMDHGWEFRQPFAPTDDTDLEPIPGHYKSALGIPF
jgi:hypothetical protein